MAGVAGRLTPRAGCVTLPRVSTFRLPRQRDALSGFADAFAAWCTQVGVPAAVATRFQIAFDELLTNAITHGAPEAANEPLVVNLRADAQRLEAEIIDAGPPFNPLAQTAPDTTLTLDERDPGGLGLLLVRELIDEVQWRHAEGRNHLRLAHPLSDAPATTG